MKQSTFQKSGRPVHVAIIMDGNGRWARSRGEPRRHGHRRGANAVRSVVEAAPQLGISVLTLYAFSSDNWCRPPEEVGHLLRLFQKYLIRELSNCLRHGVRVSVIGRRDRLPARLLSSLEAAEAGTRSGQRLLLRLAIDYSSRDSILRAALRASGSLQLDREAFSRELNLTIHSDPQTPQVDLLIRTGGERRLSDFLLWESAYAELYFTRVLWPDFSGSHLARAIRDFSRRHRRFGRVQPSPQTSLPGERLCVLKSHRK